MPDLRTETLDYLRRHQVMTLATRSADHVWAAAVFYVNYNFTLYFLSAEHTRHAQDIETNPWAAATVQEDYATWQEIKGIQLEGSVRRLECEERKRAIALYGEKYPFVNQVTGEIAAAFARVNWYQIDPVRLYFIDNSKGFGHRDEVPLD